MLMSMRENYFMNNLLNSLEKLLIDNYTNKDSILLNESIKILIKSNVKTNNTKEKIDLKITQSAQPVNTQHNISTIKNKNDETAKLHVESLKIERDVDVANINKIYMQIAPNISIHKNPPADSLPKQIRSAWKDQKSLSQIPIFVNNDVRDYLSFLNNLAHAIDITFATSKIIDITSIEGEDRWENIFSSTNIKLLIVPDLVLSKSPNLIKHFHIYSNKLIKLIGNFQAITISNIDQYFKQPMNKCQLWDTILNAINKYDV